MVDVDELCWWFLREMALKCGNYNEIEEIYYLIPHNMDEVVFDGVGVGRGIDKQVDGQMRKKQPAVVFDGVGVRSVTNEQVDSQRRKKQHAVVFDGIGVGSVTNEQSMDDSSDDELNEARQRLKKKNAELYEIAKRLQIEAAEGKLGAEQLTNPSSSALLNAERHEPLSEYEQSDEEIHTPVDSEEEGGVGRKPRVRSIVVSQNTDWNTFVWSIGQRFTTKEAFREAVIHYAVAQGKNMSFVGSSKKQLQKLEAKCLPACPFQVYGS
ncbi:hypothetical protein RDABS01_032742 [Bienertia sinuspersici]